MNTTFKTKFLLHLNQKKQETGEQGFTLIELLVVIIIIGILAAIALPSFLNQANKGKQAEAKQYVSSVNKAQQAWYTENSNFITNSTVGDWASLGVGIKTQTTNYKYAISGNADLVGVTATPFSTSLKGYAGTVALIGGAGVDKTSQSVVCETTVAGTTPPTLGVVASNDLTCGAMNAIK